MVANSNNPFRSNQDPSYEDLILPCNARLDPSVPVAQSHPGLVTSPSTHSLKDPFATPPPSSPAISPVSTPPPAISSDRTARKVGIYGPWRSPSETTPKNPASKYPITSVPDSSVYEKSSSVSSKPSLWTRFWRSLGNQFSPKAFWELINPLEYIYPMTLKKGAALALVMACVAALVVSNWATHWMEKAIKQTRSYMLPVLVIVLTLEPLMFLIILSIARVPSYNPPTGSPQTVQEVVSEKTPSDMEKATTVTTTAQEWETAFVIPCHNSDREALRKVIESAYPYFRPQDIFVIDNGRSRYPTDLTFRQWLKTLHPDIVYIWSPIGSKNAAQLVGSLAARDYKYILTTDDDVSLPNNYRHPIHLMNDKIRAVAFPLAGTDAEGDISFGMVSWQDCEYRMAGLTKLAEDRTCGVNFPHGAGWFVDRDILVELLSKYHPMDFIAEDANAGFSIMRLGKRIAFDAQVTLATEVPSTVLGPGLNWCKQRVKSWEMGRHSLIWKLIRHLFRLNGQRTIAGILMQKFLFLYTLACLVIDWVRIPVLVALGAHKEYWIFFFSLAFVACLPPLLYNYISCHHRPDMRIGLVTIATYPFYKQLYSFISVFGAVRWALFYIGGHVRAKPIRKMLEDGDDACFWLDPRFETNPAWLADEKEEMVEAKSATPVEESMTSSPHAL
jgi:cellulose synthase/poly-beta-1,6-N-acetylglucosamine synthase-like glycosyltransferase